MKKLFLDDLRTIEMVYSKSEEDNFDIVRTYDGFVAYIQKNGLPPFISFDNDLGLDESGEVAPDGYAAAKWLVYESGLDLTNLQFKVHSANPVASEQIKGLLTNYIEHERSNQLLDQISHYCSSITKSNFSRKYDGLEDIVIASNQTGLSKESILKVLTDYGIENISDDYIEEVIGEVINCIIGNTSSIHRIDLI